MDMEMDLLLALAAFALATSITPGPNNLMLMTSGANFGVRRTLPHLAGVFLGFVLMVAVVGAGVGQVLAAHPLIADGMGVIALVYVVWLAVRVARSAPDGMAKQERRPMSFLGAVLFQWVNPKGWAMALTAVSVYAPLPGVEGVVLVALVFGAVNLPSVSLWMVAGVHLRRLLGTPLRVRSFNAVMAVLLLASAVPMLVPMLVPVVGPMLLTGEP